MYALIWLMSKGDMIGHLIFRFSIYFPSKVRNFDLNNHLKNLNSRFISAKYFLNTSKIIFDEINKLVILVIICVIWIVKLHKCPKLNIF